MTGRFKKGDEVFVKDTVVYSDAHSKNGIVTRVLDVGYMVNIGKALPEHQSSYGSWHYFYNEEDLEDVKHGEKTMDDLQVGDILVDKEGFERKVLGICSLAYILSEWNNFESASSIHTLSEIKSKFTLKTEQPTPTNMTLEEIEEALGKKINIVDSKE